MSDEFQKILVIQQKMIGDVLTSTILLEALRTKYPNAELHYLVNSHTIPVVENNPFVDKLVLFTPEMENNKRFFFQFLKEIRQEKYDVVIDVYSKLSSALISYFSGAKKTIGKKKWYLDWAYSDPVILSADRRELQIPMAYINRFDFLKPLFDEIDYAIKPKIFILESEKEKVEKKLQTHRIEKKPIMVNCLGSGFFKTYPLKYLAQILDDLVAAFPEKTFLLNYIPAQKKEVQQLISFCNENTQRAISNYYAPSLREFAVLVSFCEVVIGNEGGAINIAKALNIPTFAIFAPWINSESWGHSDDPKNMHVHLKYFRPELFSGHDKKYLKQNSLELYEHFKPSFFQEKLNQFLKL